MSKQIVLITGANKGLGLETARQLGSLGMCVIVASRSASRGAVAVESLKAAGIEAYALKLDVTMAEDVDNAVAFIHKTFGVLDVLINNAGTIQGEVFMGNSTLNISMPDLRTTFETNFFGVVYLTQRLLPLIEKSHAGRIVNVSSILASMDIHSNPQSHMAAFKSFAYNASKTALNQFTLHLAAALQTKNILVNSAHPGWVKTDMGGSVAPMSVEEGAKTIVALATLETDSSVSGRFIHLGQELPW